MLSEVKLTMRPKVWALKYGQAARARLRGPRTLASKASRKVVSVISSNFVHGIGPSVALMTACYCAESLNCLLDDLIALVAESVMPRTDPAFDCRDETRPSTAFVLMSLTTTLAPDSHNALHITRPSFPAAPLTITTRPLNWSGRAAGGISSAMVNKVLKASLPEESDAIELGYHLVLNIKQLLVYTQSRVRTSARIL